LRLVLHDIVLPPTGSQSPALEEMWAVQHAMEALPLEVG
jgi:hypothetical protein